MNWRRRGAAVLIFVLTATFLPGSPTSQFAEACLPDGNAPIAPGASPAAAPSPTPTPRPGKLKRPWWPDAASSHPRTFGRQVGHIYIGDPVDVVSGAYLTNTTDLAVASRGLDFSFSRTYNSADDYWPAPMGPGWVHSYDWEYKWSVSNPDGGTLHRGDGRRGVQPDDISWTRNPDYSFTLITHDHTTYTFGLNFSRDTSCFPSNIAVVTSIKSAAGDQMNLTWRAVAIPTDPDCCTAPVLVSLTDTLGRLYTFGYDARWDLSSVTDPFQRIVRFDHNASDQLWRATDVANRSTTYGYNGSTRHLTTRTDADGKVFPVNTYRDCGGCNGTVATQTDGRSLTTSFTVSPYSSAVVTDPRAFTTTFFEDSCGVRQQQTAVGTTSFGYNAACDLTLVTDPLGNTATFAYDTGHNLRFRYDPVVPAGSPVTEYQWDTAKDLLKVIDPRQFTTEFTYDPTTKVLLTTKRQIDVTPTYATTTLAYDDSVNKLRPTRIISPLGAVTTLDYYSGGNLFHVTDPDGVRLTYEYDTYGRLSAVTDAEGHRSTRTYYLTDQLQTVADPLGHSTAYTYDAAGNVATVTDRNGNVTTYGYDSNAALATVQQRPSPGAAPYTTTIVLDDDGNLRRISEGNGNVRDVAYNAIRAVTSTTEYTLPQGTLTTTYAPDAAGLTRQRITPAPDGTTLTYGYDALQRLTSVTAPGGLAVTYRYDLAGNRDQMVDGTGTTSYSYDGAGRLRSVALPNGTISYTYNLDGSRLTMTYPGAGDVAYTYTSAGRLATITDWAGRRTAYTYWPAGRLRTVTYPNGMVASYSYDAAGQLAQITNVLGATTVSSHTYQTDGEGNRTQINEFVSGVTAPGTSDTLNYSYDGLNRLTSSSGAVSETFVLDGASNIISRTGPSTSYTYDPADRLQSDGRAFVWSSTDELRSRGSDSFAYDPLSRLTSATVTGVTANYTYNGDSLLASRGASAFLWDPIGSPASLMQSGADRVIHGLGPLYIVHADGTTTTLARDGLGSVRATVTTSGAIGSVRYTAYGAVAQSSGTLDSILGFDGDLTDPNGLIYLRARWYDPGTGRFLTADPAAAIAERPASLNRYAFAGANPVRFGDPSGLAIANPEPNTCEDTEHCYLTQGQWALITLGAILKLTDVETWGVATRAEMEAMVASATDDELMQLWNRSLANGWRIRPGRDPGTWVLEHPSLNGQHIRFNPGYGVRPGVSADHATNYIKISVNTRNGRPYHKNFDGAIRMGGNGQLDR